MIPTFARKCGVWRPDFLLTSARPRPNQAAGSVQICEINARFAFNAFFSTAYAQIAYQETDLESHNLRSPVDPEKVGRGAAPFVVLESSLTIMWA
jgi:hypothetical protein